MEAYLLMQLWLTLCAVHTYVLHAVAIHITIYAVQLIQKIIHMRNIHVRTWKSVVCLLTSVGPTTMSES